MSLLTHIDISASLLESVKKTLEESNEYQKKVQAHMAKKGIKSLNDLTDDQKKKFFNELDAMHKAKNEEVEAVEEGTGVTDYAPKSQGGTRKELLAKYHKSKNPKDAEAARKAGATQKELQGEEVEAVTEGSTSKEKQKTPYRDITSPEHRAAADKQKEKMKQDAAAGPGKKLLDKIKSKAKNEEVEAVEESFSDAQISQLRGEMSKVSGIDPASPTYKKLVDMLNNMGMKELTKLADANIKFISGLARNRVIRAGMKKEEVELDEEQLNELDKSTLASYIKKRSHDVATMGAVTRKHAMDSEAAKKDQNYTQARKSDEMSNKAFAKGWKHRQNIAKAVDKLTKEEVEEIDELSKGTLASYVKKSNVETGIQGMKIAAPSEKDDYEKRGKTVDKFMKRMAGVSKAVDKLTKEEIEFIESLNAKETSDE
jgi:hypothetical protein